MKRTTITTVETRVSFAETLIEDHINKMHHAEKHFGKNGKTISNVLWKNYESMSWCCEHSPLEGTVDIEFRTRHGNGLKNISVPVVTNFGVVCTKDKERNYKITWSYSLS